MHRIVCFPFWGRGFGNSVPPKRWFIEQIVTGGCICPAGENIPRHVSRRIASPMNKPFAKVPDALARLLIVFAVVIGVTFVVVKFVTPPRFKDTNLQWADTVRRENAKPVRFAGAVACADCHAEVVAEKRKGYHRDLSCETCHRA